jgi:hypothetical protein
MTPSRILSNLYLGSSNQASNFQMLQDLRITHIVVCAASIIPSFPDKFSYHVIPSMTFRRRGFFLISRMPSNLSTRGGRKETFLCTGTSSGEFYLYLSSNGLQFLPRADIGAVLQGYPGLPRWFLHIS